MPRDDDNSLGDEATVQGGTPNPADERSLGDRSTFGGGEGSSLSGIGEFADLPDHDMEIVDLSSRYKLETSLGKGGMGEVLLATDTRLDRKVAIKRILGGAGSSKAAVARFLIEAKSVAALNHNNVVQIHDYGRDAQGPFLIMEYVTGGTLLDRCRKGPIELEEAVDLACQLCGGLTRAHDSGIVHRDIKPANILLTEDGIPKLSDFGLAKAESREQTMTMTGSVLGTFDFMPPEQRQDTSLVDARSDLWSLAATLYQMVTGKSPKIIRFDSLPQSLTNVLGKALEEAKNDRYQSASELKDALKQSLRGGPASNLELEVGTCPSCGTRNEGSRKFCRNTSCAASLRVTCLSCSAIIPIWEGVCGECGSIQTDLLEQRRVEMGALRAEAETCVTEHEYARAIEIAREINNEDDPRLQQLKNWSAEFAGQVESVKRAQIENTRNAIAEALSHEKAHDYRSGIQALNQIPPAVLAVTDVADVESAKVLLERLHEKHARAESLETEIKSKVRSRNLTGLLVQVDHLLELFPERSDLLKLQNQLQTRDAGVEKARLKTLAAAKKAMQQHDYAGVMSLVAKLAPEQIDTELDELRVLADALEARSTALIQQVRKSVENEQHDGLLALTEEYLSLKPNDAEALKSRDYLLRLKESEQAEAAARLALQAEEQRKKRAAAEALVTKKRSRDLHLLVGFSIAAAFVVMLTVMFELRSQGIARDISENLSRGDYAAALALDPANEEALVMRRNSEALANALKSGDYQSALLIDPTDAQALSLKKAAVIAQALSEGDFFSALQVDPNNAQALSMKKSASVQRALADGDYFAALQIDPTNAEACAAMLGLPPITNSIGMELKWLPPGKFDMGRGIIYKLTLTKAFMMGIHEVTQSQYELVMGVNPSRFNGVNNPVEQVSWDDAVEFCRKLSALPAEKAAGRVYRLPTEAEWEYACRAGTTTDYSFGDDQSELGQYAVYSRNVSHTEPVGVKEPNAWGLYDMHGNVGEWCADWYGSLRGGSVTDPRGARGGSERVTRGGSWLSGAWYCQSALRSWEVPSERTDHNGFRVALSLSGK